ncbi:MAG TPA: (2Fe-2S)-binding protein [Streptosporangiaceae bacterium]|nr:(2Fe-2S)-binding protein [Streptosporangiaceae bacterium]
MTEKHQVRLRVNGTEHELLVEARRTLADMLRHDLGYTGTNVGCEHGICGACTVRLDGAPVRSCLVFGVQADGAEVRTVEGLADGDELSDLQQAFRDHHALQCGFCTPGFLMLAEAYFAERGLVQPGLPPGQPPAGAVRSEPPAGAAEHEAPAGDGAQPGDGAEPGEVEIRELVASNLCRCTGYQGIVAAMLATARSRYAAGRE